MNVPFSRSNQWSVFALLTTLTVIVGCASSSQHQGAEKEGTFQKAITEKTPNKPEDKPVRESAVHAESGVQFVSGDLDNALEMAKKKNQNILVEVWAAWCPPCRAQKAEVFDKEAGLALTRKLVSWQMDFDVDKNRPLVEKWRILNLPTVLFLRPDGSEIGRIEGYEDKERFIAEAEQLALGEDELPKWQALLKERQESPLAERTETMVEVGHRLLVRGDQQGRILLEEVVAGDVKHEWESAQQALFLLGRYHSRVKQDFKTGELVWRSLHDGYPTGKYVITAAWWTAGAMSEQGQAEQAVAFLVDRTHGIPSADDIDLVVSFVAKSKLGVDKAKALLDSVDDKIVKKAQREEWEKTLTAIAEAKPVE